MKTTLTTQEIARKLVETDSFTWAGAMALAEYLEELEDQIGEEIKFDRVAIQCDYSEYESLEDWYNDYHGDESFESDKETRRYIQDHGTLIEFDGGVIVSNF